MPVTNSHSEEKLPWTEPGMTGMPIKPTGRPSGVLANLAGIAENVGNLSEEERAKRERPDRLLEMSETPPHVAEIVESHYRAGSSPGSLAFRAMDGAIATATRGGKLIRRALRR